MKRSGFVYRNVFRLVIVIALVTAVVGCATFERIGFAWNLVRAMRAGTRFRENHEPTALDVPFTTLSDVTLDVFAPDSGGGHPVLIFVHGGGWDQFDKETFSPVAMQLVPRDLVVVIPDYTLYPDAGYRQMTGEVADAVAWTFEHIAEYGGDPQRITLSGHSAGGHLSGLVAFDERWLENVGLEPADLHGWIGLSGVYDVAAQMEFERSTGGDAPVMTAVMGGEANFAAASPISYVGGPEEANGTGVDRADRVDGPGVNKAGSRPDPMSADKAGSQPEGASGGRRPGRGFHVTLIHGARDETVPISIAESFAARLVEAGVDPEVIVYQEGDHVDFLFAALSDPDAPVLLDIAEAAARD